MEHPLFWKKRESGNGEERSNQGAVRIMGKVRGTKRRMLAAELPLPSPTLAPRHLGFFSLAA